MSARALERRGREARTWLLEACFPLWADRGVNRQNGFIEALDLQHRPIEAQTARVRVLARQTYVFAQALRLGWSLDRAAGYVELGVSLLDKAARRPDGLYGRTLELGAGRLADDTADLYDTAFALYALAEVRKLSLPDGSENPFLKRTEALIMQTCEALEVHLGDPSGGYIESLPRPKYRMQNPHMHLFEASLALYEGTGDAGHLARASKLRALFLTRFFDQETGTLGEYFTPETWAIPEGAAGEIVEPGHHFEWVWLLARYALLTKGALPEEAHRLYDLACKTLDEDGRAAQSSTRAGVGVDLSRRTWPQTEALKAHLTMWLAGDEAAGARAVNSFDILMDEYLTPEGGWIDHYSAEGQVIGETMPASTGYHVVLAFAELIKAVEA